MSAVISESVNRGREGADACPPGVFTTVHQRDAPLHALDLRADLVGFRLRRVARGCGGDPGVTANQLKKTFLARLTATNRN